MYTSDLQSCEAFSIAHIPETDFNIQISRKQQEEFSKHTLNCDTEISLVLSRRVGDHTSVLSFMGQRGVFYDEAVAKLLNASMDAPSQRL